MDNLCKRLEMCADAYERLPYGREAEGTKELLREAAEALCRYGEVLNRTSEVRTQEYIDNMYSEQVKGLRKLAKDYAKTGFGFYRTDRVLRKAADTIEELSARLASANMELKFMHCDLLQNHTIDEEKLSTVLKLGLAEYERLNNWKDT